MAKGEDMEIPKVLKGKGVSDSSLDIYDRRSSGEPGDFLIFYKRVVMSVFNKRRKIKNPINKHTGRPLKEAPLKTYRSSLPLKFELKKRTTSGVVHFKEPVNL
jgi:hypothetical protein